jgi:hypothetical protein
MHGTGKGGDVTGQSYIYLLTYSVFGGCTKAIAAWRHAGSSCIFPKWEFPCMKAGERRGPHW